MENELFEKTVGERMRYLRNSRNLSAAYLADALDISVKHYRDIENDRALPELVVAVKFAMIFGISVNELVTGVKDYEEDDDKNPLL